MVSSPTGFGAWGATDRTPVRSVALALASGVESPVGTPLRPWAATTTSTAADDGSGSVSRSASLRPSVTFPLVTSEGPHGPSLCDTAGSPRGVRATIPRGYNPAGRSASLLPVVCSARSPVPALRAPLKSARGSVRSVVLAFASRARPAAQMPPGRARQLEATGWPGSPMPEAAAAGAPKTALWARMRPEKRAARVTEGAAQRKAY